MTGATELRALLRGEAMVIAPGAYDGLTAKLVAQAGFPAVYMTGAATSVSHGYPDFGLLTMSEMVENAARIVRSVDVPVIADADTGYGNELNVFRTVQEYERCGVAGIHIEDQVSPKKCGHLDDKEIVSREDYIAKIRAAVAAKRDGDFWVLNGAKTFTTNGHYADFCVAMAVTDKSKGSHGISAFILEKGMAGFKPGKKENKLGMRASDTSEVIFSDCRVPAENLLGPEGEGFTGSLKILDGGRISIAALALGMAQGALDAAVSYAKQRKQFGQAISEFQAIQFKLADMATEVEAARLLVYQAAWLADRKDVRFTRESSMAKLFASEVAVRVANECVQVHGGYGFIKDYPAEKFYRDVKLCTIGEGTSEIQKLVIARQLLGKK